MLNQVETEEYSEELVSECIQMMEEIALIHEQLAAIQQTCPSAVAAAVYGIETKYMTEEEWNKMEAELSEPDPQAAAAAAGSSPLTTGWLTGCPLSAPSHASISAFKEKLVRPEPLTYKGSYTFRTQGQLAEFADSLPGMASTWERISKPCAGPLNKPLSTLGKKKRVTPTVCGSVSGFLQLKEPEPTWLKSPLPSVEELEAATSLIRMANTSYDITEEFLPPSPLLLRQETMLPRYTGSMALQGLERPVSPLTLPQMPIGKALETIGGMDTKDKKM